MTLVMRDLENQEIGIEKEQRRQIERLLMKGKTVEEIADLGGYSQELIESVQESLLAAR